MSLKFGKRLKKLRNEKGINQKELADKMNTTKATISRYENDKQEPSVLILEKLAEYFNTSTDYILGKSDARDPLWYEKLPAELQNFIKEENVEYLSVAFRAKEENWSPEAIEEVMKVIKSLKK